MLENKTFYPTPPSIIKRMIKLIKPSPNRVLEPSAGKGDLIEALITEEYREGPDGARGGYYSSLANRSAVSAIELDQDLRATLRGKGIKVIDSNFLEFSGPDKFDLIFANPPFDHGDLHLLKAIDIMYCGQIIFLLNASTLRNPHTNSRKDLVRKLEELNAEIEYVDGAFKDAERKADVDIAIVNIVIERKIENDLFADLDDAKETPVDEDLGESKELITGKRIHDLVSEHNDLVNLSTETILSYYKNYPKIGKYIGLNGEPDRYSSGSTLTGIVQNTMNSTIELIRKDFWRKALTLSEVTSRLTENKSKEFHHMVDQRCQMAFTENNIRQFVLNLMNGFEDTVRDSILSMFDKFTIKHTYRGTPQDKNIHYFNGWKTNDAYKVAKRIIVPIYGNGYGTGPFIGYNGWELSYGCHATLNDIDIVMNYFDGRRPNYYSIAEALQHSFADGENTTESTYFSKIIAYKKGTLHLTFANEDILRRFNIEACRGKNWLPEDYGQNYYKDLGAEHKTVVDAFEGKKSYVENFGRIGLNCGKMEKIEAPKKGQLGLFED